MEVLKNGRSQVKIQVVDRHFFFSKTNGFMGFGLSESAAYPSNSHQIIGGMMIIS